MIKPEKLQVVVSQSIHIVYTFFNVYFFSFYVLPLEHINFTQFFLFLILIKQITQSLAHE